MEKLNLFFAQIKDISFWQRLFHWRKVRTLSFDAYEEYRSSCPGDGGKQGEH